MAVTKPTGPVAVLESSFKIIPWKETDLLVYPVKVVPLALKQDGFRAVHSGPVRALPL